MIPLLIFLLVAGAVFAAIVWCYLVFVEYRIKRDTEAENDDTFNPGGAFIFAWVALFAAARKFLQWIKSLL